MHSKTIKLVSVVVDLCQSDVAPLQLANSISCENFVSLALPYTNRWVLHVNLALLMEPSVIAAEEDV